MTKRPIQWLLLVFLVSSCQSRYLPRQHDAFPQIVDTSTKPIEIQEKKKVEVNGIAADNMFDAARMNQFEAIDDSTFRVTILPENTPINPSPHFAFRLSSAIDRSIDLEIFYGEYKHRYWPKLSYDGAVWIPLDSTRFDTLKAGNLATLRLDLDERPLFVSAQELYSSSRVRQWTESVAEKPHVSLGIGGQSMMGRDIFYLDMCKGDKKKKDAIVILSRQHPPEVSGYIAMEAFVEYILDDNPLSNAFRDKYRILVYPLVNPDGVDMGHWRHNAGGIDLNRDWAYYRQPETRIVARHIVRTTAEYKNDVILGLDFHSTQEDVYYTMTDNRPSSIYDFKDYWIYGIDQSIDGYTPDDQPNDLNTPITKGWFYLQFGAEGITYEIGDETPRDFVREKSRVAAREMMQLLVLR